MLISESSSEIVSNKNMVVHKALLVGVEPVEVTGLGTFGDAKVFSIQEKEALKQALFGVDVKQVQDETLPIDREERRKEEEKRTNRFTGFADDFEE